MEADGFEECGACGQFVRNGVGHSASCGLTYGKEGDHG